MNFEQWFTELKSNPLWWMRVQEMYSRKNLDKVANEVYTYLIASPEAFKAQCEAGDTAGWRKLFQTWAGKSDDAPVKPQLQQVEEKKDDKEWKPASPEHVDKCVKEFFDMLKDAPMITYKPTKEAIFYNGRHTEKLQPHPVTSLQEAYVRDRHFEWIKNNFEARTGQKLPSWICEEDWNVIYDDQHLNGKGL